MPLRADTLRGVIPGAQPSFRHYALLVLLLIFHAALSMLRQIFAAAVCQSAIHDCLRFDSASCFRCLAMLCCRHATTLLLTMILLQLRRNIILLNVTECCAQMFYDDMTLHEYPDRTVAATPRHARRWLPRMIRCRFLPLMFHATIPVFAADAAFRLMPVLHMATISAFMPPRCCYCRRRLIYC